MNFIESYQTTLRELIQEQAESIANGSCGDMEEYRYRVGVRRGLTHALDKFSDTLKQFVAEEDKPY